jgi:hypothetical protein
MLFTASYSNLETMVPGIDTNPDDINPGGPPPDSFSDTPWAGGTTMNIDGPQWAAGLSKRSVTVLGDLLASIGQVTMSCYIRPSQLARVLSQAHENDLMVTDGLAKPNRYNGSIRKNNQEGGMWQVANSAGGWVDTGFKAGLFAADVWTAFSVVYEITWGVGIRVASITDNGVLFSCSTALVAAIPNSGWAPNLLDWQSQDTLLAAGAFTRDMKNVSLALQ